MVEPAKRSRSVKKVKRKTPGGRVTTHFKAGKSSKNVCGRCSGILGGTPSTVNSKLKNMSKSSKSPDKPYSGVLCTKCLDSLARYVTRFEATNVEGFENLDLTRDLTLEKYLPRGWYDNLSKK